MKERNLVHQLAARGVQQHGVPLHQPERALTHDVACFRTGRQMQADDVRFAEQLLERAIFHTQ